MTRKQAALLAGILALLLFGLLLCACGGSPAPSYSVPDYPYEPADIEGLSLPLRRVEGSGQNPVVSEPAGTLTFKNGLFSADITEFFDPDEDVPIFAEQPGGEEILTSALADTALNVAQFEAEGYTLKYFLYYFHSYYLVAEKDGAEYVLPGCGRTDDTGYQDYGHLFDEPMTLEKFFERIKKYWAQDGAESLSGGWGFDEGLS